MQDTLSARLSSVDSEALFRELESSGFVCLDSALPESELKQLRDAVSGLVAARGKVSQSLIQPWKTIPAFARWMETSAFSSLLRSLALRAWKKDGVEGSHIYNVLRVITGPEASRERPLLFHYDATIVTALVPIFIPGGEPEQAGDFVCFPNLRPIRRFVLINLVEKILMQNSVTRFFFARAVRLRKPSAKIVRLVPGNIYLFWGYRTYHANFSCSPDALRATLLFHFGDPHLGSLVTRSILAVRRWRVSSGDKSGLINDTKTAGR